MDCLPRALIKCHHALGEVLAHAVDTRYICATTAQIFEKKNAVENERANNQ